MQVKIENFKCICAVNFAVPCIVSGTNGVGKSTLFDAVKWALLLNGDADIFPIAKTIKNTTVTLDNGTWCISRSAIKKSTTEYQYFIGKNLIECKKKEYVEYLEKNTYSEKIFTLLNISPVALQDIHWKDLRSAIVAKTNYKFKDIPSFISLSLEEDRKFLNKRIKETQILIQKSQQEIEILESQIDRSINFDTVRENLAELIEKRREFENKLVSPDLQIVSDAMREDIMRYSADIADRSGKINTKMIEHSALNEPLMTESSEINSKISQLNRKITAYEDRAVTLRQNYTTERNMKFEIFAETQTGNCPACGQRMDSDVAKRSFEDARRKKLEKINQDGQSIVAEIKIFREEIKVLQENLAVVTKKMFTNKSAIQNLSEELRELQSTKFSASGDNAPSDERKMKDKIRSELREKMQNIDKELQTVQKTLAQEDVLNKNTARIRSVEQQIKETQSKLTEDMRNIVEIDKCLQSNNRELEKSVNLGDADMRLSLFEKLQNGEFQDCCKIYYKDVPYEYLNYASKINIGLSLIDWFGLDKLPVVIDNAESVVELRKTIAKQIVLRVDSTQKELSIV